MPRSGPILVLLCLLAASAGFGLGRWTAPRVEEELTSIASFRAALEEPDWLTRTYRVSAFLQGLSPENLPEALAAIEAQLPWLPTEELRLFMLAWVRFDPMGALDRALGWPPPFNRNASGAAIYAWALHQPAAAQVAVDTATDPELQEFMEERMIAGWTHGAYKQSASDYIAAMPEGPRRFRYVGLLAWELSKDGPEKVKQWAEAVPDDHPTYKAAVFLKASSTLAAIDPAGTAAWLEGHLGRPYADGVLRVVVRSWAVQDPTAALAWLAQLPEGEGRDASVANAFSVWRQRAPEEAERWLRRETPARPLDPALRWMVGETRREAPEAASAWAAALADPALRREVLDNLAAARQGRTDAAPPEASATSLP